MKIKFITVIYCICIVISANSQNRDYQTWLTLDFSLPLYNKISFNFENETRFINNSSLLGRNQLESELLYPLTKRLSVSAGYRYKTDYPFSEYSESWHTWLTNILYNIRKNRFRINTRFRLMSRTDDLFSESVNNNLIHREKVRLGYKIRKTPCLVYIGTETYFQINSYTPFELRKLRMFAGGWYQLNKVSRISVDFIHDRAYNRRIPERNFILQFGYSLDFEKLEN